MNNTNPKLSPFYDPSKFYLEPYIYSFYLASIAGGVSDTASYTVDSSSYFIWCKTTAFADIAQGLQTNATRVIPIMTVQINDTGSSKQLYDRAQPMNNIAGNEGLPSILQQPYVVKQNSAMQATFTNLTGATTYADVYLSCIGFRAYPLG